MPDADSFPTFRFAGFELRPRERMLLSAGEPVAVGARAFDVLVALVERRGKLVTKDELFDRVWPKVVVEENNLQVQVSALRKVVGQEAIVTVPGHGYRFALALEAVMEGTAAPVRPRPQVLPWQATTFVGRVAEVRAAIRLLEQARLLTLVGMGGIGKTRLSLEVARTASGGFADGVAFVDLAPVADATAVVDVAALALDVKPSPGQLLKHALLQQVATRRQLIVLDNCEHLLAACAKLAAELLQASAESKVIATSREPLHTAGEVLYEVPALAAPPADAAADALANYPAVRLFMERAQAIHPQFALTAQISGVVGQICRDLDGIPLALELAAARLRAMPAEAVAAHLSERFRLLVRGNRAAQPRQQSLRAAIDWSYDLLTDAERALLRRLSVFAGGFAVDAAEAVGAGSDVARGDVLYLLADLVDKSLVSFDPWGNRYRLLETVRQYARERLDESGKTEESRDQHLSFYVTFGEHVMRELRGPRQWEFLVRSEAERDNIVAAFAHARESPDGGPAGLALAYGFLTALAPNHPELSGRLARDALAHPGALAEDVGRCRALYVMGWSDFWAGRYGSARVHAEESVRIARVCNDPRTLAEALYRLGCICTQLRHVADAEAYLSEELGLGQELGVAALVADAHGGLAELYTLEGRLELAQYHYAEGLATGSQEPDYQVIGNLNLARNAIMLREPAAALRYLRAALAARPAMPSHFQTAFTLTTSAGVALLRGEPVRALHYLGAAAAIGERTGFRDSEPDASFNQRNLAAAREAAGSAATEAFAEGQRMDEAAADENARTWVESLPAVWPVAGKSVRSA